MGMQKTWKVSVLFVLLFCGAKHTLAQESENVQQEAVRRLQERIDELKTQMNAVQAELDALRATTPPAHQAKNNQPAAEPPRTGTIENAKPPAPSVWMGATEGWGYIERTASSNLRTIHVRQVASGIIVEQPT
jgi:hypothetical protein